MTDSTDLNRVGVDRGHRLLRRTRFLSSIPLVGQGDPRLARLAAGEGQDARTGRRGADDGPDDAA
jgi:hypothetical protein